MFAKVFLKILYTLLLFTLFTGVNLSRAGASSRCEYLFTESLAFRDFPMMIHVGLPKDFVEAVKEHPIMSLQGRIIDKKIIFGSKRYEPNRIGAGGTMGEEIQTMFLARTLKVIFPEVEFIQTQPHDPKWLANLKHENPEQQLITFDVVDPAEWDMKNDNVMPMPLLKAANPGLSGLRHNDLRQKLGIPDSASVVGVYTKMDTIPEVIKAVVEATNPNIIFLSPGGTTAGTLTEYLLTENFQNTHRIIPLSKVTAQDFKNPEPLIVMNDLGGKIPYIANVADSVVVAGAINFFEPLNSSAKTIIVSDPQFRGRYRELEYRQMIEKAKLTGIGFEVPSLDALKSQLQNIINTPATQNPLPVYRIKAGERTILEEYLDKLKIEIERQL